jgi:putative flippase GtrA
LRKKSKNLDLHKKIITTYYEVSYIDNPDLNSFYGMRFLPILILLCAIISKLDLKKYMLLLIYVHLNIYIASIVSVTIATIFNYFLSYKIAFLRGKFSRKHEIFRLFFISFSGLFINNLIFFSLIYFLNLNLFISKIIPIPATLLWNFFGRRYFVFFKQRPIIKIL